MEDFSFSGKNALVIGGTSSIGLELAALLAGARASVTVTGRHPPAADARLSFLPMDCDAPSFSLLDTPGLADALRCCDILAVCYGPFVQKPLHQTTPADWQRMALHNYALPGMAACAALPRMRMQRYGRIILFGGTRTDAVRAYRTNAAYAGAKTGVAVIIKSLAAAYGGEGITCNGIFPGFTRNAPPGAQETSPRLLAAHAMYLLAHPELNGVLLTADGGWQPGGPAGTIPPEISI